VRHHYPHHTHHHLNLGMSLFLFRIRWREILKILHKPFTSSIFISSEMAKITYRDQSDECCRK
jgi:hypothetical protein